MLEVFLRMVTFENRAELALHLAGQFERVQRVVEVLQSAALFGAGLLA